MKHFFDVCLLVSVLLWGLDIGTFASDPIDQAFPKVGGGSYQLPEKQEAEATVLVFFGHDCPVSNGYVPELKRLYAEFKAKGIAFCIVYADADLAQVDAEAHTKEYGIECPAIVDSELKLAARFGATVKPEVAVVSADRTLLYRGRIDNRYVDFGKQRIQPTSRELRAAIEAIINKQTISITRTKALGCGIYFPKPAKP